jgi:hypothetical protein
LLINQYATGLRRGSVYSEGKPTIGQHPLEIRGVVSDVELRTDRQRRPGHVARRGYGISWRRFG